jgi:hypothetical protein
MLQFQLKQFLEAVLVIFWRQLYQFLQKNIKDG